GDNVVAAILVAVINHRRQRRGLAGTGWAGDDHQSLVQHPKFSQHRRQWRVKLFEIFERKHLRWYLAEDGGAAVFLVEKIGAEARHVRDFVTEVHVTRFFIRFDFILGRDFVEHRL